MEKPSEAKKPLRYRALPEDVMQMLREQASAKTQVAMADELGVSTTSINQALHGKFIGHVDRFAARVRGQWGGDTVTCPVLGSINTKVCLDQQSKGAVYSNPMRVALARACKRCPHRQQTATTGGTDHE